MSPGTVGSFCFCSFVFDTQCLDPTVVALTPPGLLPCMREAEKEKVILHFHFGVIDLRLFPTYLWPEAVWGQAQGVTMA